MNLTERQRSNIRHFIYYLVKGTLDFPLRERIFEDKYPNFLATNPDCFYAAACVFINQEIALRPGWPDVGKLARFVAHQYDESVDADDFEVWELDLTSDDNGLASAFKRFTAWFISTSVVPGFSYEDYILKGASFAERCFAIWANAAAFDENGITNETYATGRVAEFIRSYAVPGYRSDLEDWEQQMC